MAAIEKGSAGLLKFKHNAPELKFLDFEVGAYDQKAIIVRVKGGRVIEIDNIPDNMEIEVRDYDLNDPDPEEVFNDQEGDYIQDCYFGKEDDDPNAEFRGMHNEAPYGKGNE